MNGRGRESQVSSGVGLLLPCTLHVHADNTNWTQISHISMSYVYLYMTCCWEGEPQTPEELEWGSEEWIDLKENMHPSMKEK